MHTLPRLGTLLQFHSNDLELQNCDLMSSNNPFHRHFQLPENRMHSNSLGCPALLRQQFDTMTA